MTHFTSYVLVAALHAVPCEYVIDFGPVPVPFAYRMPLTLTTRDGTRLDDLRVEWAANADPKGNRDDLVIFLRDHGWATRTGPGNCVVVTGRLDGKKSPVRSVAIASEQAIPVSVRWVPLLPEKK